MLNLLLGLLISATALPAKPARYVTDNAAVLPADVASAIDTKLQAFERETSNQVIVYIDRKVPDGTTLEEMGAQAIREWGIGQKEKNNGAILFLFTEDRKMRIEVGYGLEGTLTDAKSKLITSTIMKPRLKDGDYAGAVQHGVDAILNTVRGEGYVGSGRTVAEANAAPMRSSNDVLSCALILLIPAIFIGSVVALIVYLLRKTKTSLSDFVSSLPPTSSGSSSSSSISSDSSSSFSSSDSSSSSSSDFSGGGGDGGGGGASDSW